MFARLVTFQNVTTLSFSSAGLVQRAGRAGGTDANNAVSFFDAIEAQVGLKLEKHKRPIPCW